jgi:hypothetical protein
MQKAAMAGDCKVTALPPRAVLPRLKLLFPGRECPRPFTARPNFSTPTFSLPCLPVLHRTVSRKNFRTRLGHHTIRHPPSIPTRFGTKRLFGKPLALQ